MPSDSNIPLQPMPGRGAPAASPPIPSFGMLPRGSMLQRMKSNFAECITAAPRGIPPWQFAVMFRSAYFPKRFPTHPLLQSIFLHVCVVTLWISQPAAPGPRRAADEIETARRENRLIYYAPADRLPPVSPLEPPPPPQPPPLRSPRVRLRMARGPERVISRPPRPDNSRQTIVQPEAPQLRLPTDVEVPNLVAWSPAPPPPSPSVSITQPQVAAIRAPRVQAPAAPAPVPAPPKLALPDVSVPAAPSAGLPNAPVPPRPSVSEAQRQLTALRVPQMPNLVAVGVAPAPPPVRIQIPPGNRSGEFAISPDGEQLDARPSGRSSEGVAREAPPLPQFGIVGEVADIRVPNLSIAGDRSDFPPPPVPVVSEAPEPRAGPRVGPRSAISPVQPEGDLRTLMARATRPSFAEMTRGKSVDPLPEVFGDRRIYTVYINMPNLASGAGSWILRFAERDGPESGGNESEGKGSGDEGISSPVAVRKVDPKYAPAAIRERVEGTVTLAAHILRSGKVTSVKVVQGLDPRLDLSAVQALTLWQFEPARKKGVPIDLEVLVQIPFRLPAF